MSTIQEVKKELGISDADIAEFFDYKNDISYRNSTRKPCIDKGIISIYKLAKKSVGEKNMVE